MKRILARYPALSSRDYVLQLIGQFVSNAGTQMQVVAINWQLYEMTRSPFVLALLGISRIIPIIAFSLVGGAVVDSHNRKKILYVTQIIQAVCALIQGVLTMTGTATPVNLLLLNAVIIAAYSFDSPARAALLPSLVKREHFGNAVSLNIIGYNVSTMAGPALGGILIATAGIASVYVIDAVSYAILLVTLALMNADGTVADRRPFSLSSVAEGLRFVRSRELIWSTMLLDFFATFFGEATILIPVFAHDILHVGPDLAGLLYAAPFIGATAVGIVSASVGTRVHTGTVLLSSVALYAIGTIAFGISTSFPLSILALMLVGAGDGMSAIIRNIVRQLTTPDHLRGRMTAINQIFYTGGPRLGEVESGLVAGLVGAPMTVVIGGVGTLLAVLLIGARIPALRRYSHE